MYGKLPPINLDAASQRDLLKVMDKVNNIEYKLNLILKKLEIEYYDMPDYMKGIDRK